MSMIIDPYKFSTSGGGGGGSVPTSSALKVWLETTSGVLYNSSNLSNQWNDQTSYANNAVQSTTFYKPTYAATDAALNNLPSLTFQGGSDDRMEIPVNSSLNWSANGFSLYMVVYIQNFMSSWSTIIAHSNDATMTQGWGIYYYNGEIYFWVGNWNNVANYVKMPNVPTNTKLLIKFTWNKTTITASYRTASGTVTSGTKAFSGPYTNPSSYNIGIMNLPGGNTTYDVTGKLGSILIYDGVLSSTDDTNLQNYLKNKYNIL